MGGDQPQKIFFFAFKLREKYPFFDKYSYTLIYIFLTF